MSGNAHGPTVAQRDADSPAAQAGGEEPMSASRSASTSA